jgi:hypothetical protein
MKWAATEETKVPFRSFSWRLRAFVVRQLSKPLRLEDSKNCPWLIANMGNFEQSTIGSLITGSSIKT